MDARYAWVSEVCASCIHRQGEDSHGLTFSDHVDQILTHKLWGWLAFIGMMSLMFVCIFVVAKWPMDWITGGKDWLANLVRAHMDAGDLRSLIVDGVIGGVGNVVIFLPQILILFFFLGLLEDSGYGARGVHHGSHDVARRAAREIIRATAQFVRLRDPRHHGHAHD